MALLLAFPLLLGPTAATAGGGVRPYDDGPVLRSFDAVGDLPIELALEFFTGPPPASWAPESIPVEICSQQANRPFAVTAQEFRDVLTSATAMWTASGLAVGFSYVGDCEHANRWQFENGITEIGFDDFRDVVKGQSAAVATGTWTTIFGGKEFIEFDIVLDRRLNLPLQCFESVIAHELGHVLGLGHSDDARDLMFPSFNPNDLGTCPTEARAAELDALRTLYGDNFAPTIEEPAAIVIGAGDEATISVVAVDAEDDPLTFVWEQTDGETVAFEANGPTLTLSAPDTPGAELRFRVTVSDPFGHATSVEVLIGIDATPAPPSTGPTLAGIGVSIGGDDAAFEWALPPGATSFELCSQGTVELCSRTTSASQAISWETVISQAGSSSAYRVFSGGARLTSAAACNGAGCGPSVEGPLAGGLRWLPWDIDFDYFGMAMDLPGVSITIAGAVNLSATPRQFTLYSGTELNPQQRVLRRCGELGPGESCLGVLLPGDRGHGDIVTVVSSAAGTPTTEHRVTIR